MKFYMVTTYAPLFAGCGKNRQKAKVFTGITSAKTHMAKERKRCEQFEESYILLEELVLKELKKEDLRSALESEDITDLIGTRERLIEHEVTLESKH
jgi:hypothetical protein